MVQLAAIVCLDHILGYLSTANTILKEKLLMLVLKCLHSRVLPFSKLFGKVPLCHAVSLLMSRSALCKVHTSPLIIWDTKYRSLLKLLLFLVLNHGHFLPVFRTAYKVTVIRLLCCHVADLVGVSL